MTERLLNMRLIKLKREKKVFDLEAIKERLNTFIDLKGYKVK